MPRRFSRFCKGVYTKLRPRGVFGLSSGVFGAGRIGVVRGLQRVADAAFASDRDGVTRLLKLLAQEEMYGYEIVQAISLRTEAVIAVGEGVVYPVFHGLERDGALSARRKTVNGRSRIYYSVTPAGSRRLADMAEGWNDLASAIQKMLIKWYRQNFIFQILKLIFCFESFLYH